MNFKARRPSYASLLLLSLSALAGPLLAAPPLRLGVNPYQDPSELQARWQPLVHYLSARSGRDIELVIAGDYQRHIAACVRKEYDLAYLGPIPYLQRVAAKGPVTLLARFRDLGATTFRGAIVAREDSPLASISDLAGHSFAFGDRYSTMSHFLPLVALAEAGVGVESLSHSEFLGSHDNVALAVLMGRFDAGGLKPSVFERYQERGLKVLAWTEAVPTHVLAAHRDLDPATRQSLQQALYALNDPGLAAQVLHPIGPDLDGMSPAQDSDYDSLRQLLARTGVNLLGFRPDARRN